MFFDRKKYLKELIAGRGNGLVKIITGVRRCGKSIPVKRRGDRVSRQR